jgi:crossover junction endodeoxyribonuclease RuvC
MTPVKRMKLVDLIADLCRLRTIIIDISVRDRDVSTRFLLTVVDATVDDLTARLYDGDGMKIIGVDPGLVSGALAIIEVTGTVPSLVDVIDIPTIGVGPKMRIDVIATHDFVTRHKPVLAVIERSGPMPRQGTASVFRYARACGSIEATITLSAIPVEFIEPRIWKKFFRIFGKDKERARQLALEKFPVQHSLFARKRDHNRAEACMLALFGVLSFSSATFPARASTGAQLGLNRTTDNL